MLHKSVFIQSNTIIGQDERVQSYCGLKLVDIPASGSGPSYIRASKKTSNGAALTSAAQILFMQSILAAYHNLGPPSYECSSCHAIMWYEERNDKAKRAVNPTFSLCCQEGKVLLPRFNETPPPLKKLLDYNDATTSRFKDQIRVYNSSILPAEGVQPRYAQLYFFDTENEIRNRMSAFVDNDTRETVDEIIVASLIQINNQDTLRVDLYHNLRDAVTRGDISAAGLGKRIVLPKTFTGSPRQLSYHLPDQNAITLHDSENLPALLEREVSRQLQLWGENWVALSEDILHKKRKLYRYPDLQLTEEQLRNYCLLEIQELEALAFDMNKSKVEHEQLHSFIASLLLPGGRTAHIRFVILLELMGNNTCGIKQNIHLEKLMQEVKLIIWDEALMTQRYAFEALDKTLRDILGYDGIAMSMRVNEYTGNGEIDTRKQNFNRWVSSKKSKGRMSQHGFRFQKNPLLNYGIHLLNRLCQETCPDFTTSQTDDKYLKERAILTPRNDDADAINDYMFKKLGGESVTYNSAHEICKASMNTLDQHNLYPVEFLNSLNFPGMPPHALCLKKELPIMLRRNVNPNKGLCNGTRLIITDLAQFVIRAKILTGSHIGDNVLKHRIVLTSTQSKWPFVLKRRQFPVKPCYVMTINKSQGRSLNYVGLYLPNPSVMVSFMWLYLESQALRDYKS
ncbi:ATP-dependent DNA helicase PIF1-like protein [Tanacetum coccineum]|uniref:ATP-dependent DNA helicase n=1 Tax=Tanacetum coccineum TaxID=301880 RepID=A0ABQ5EZT6_9ASTR